MASPHEAPERIVTTRRFLGVNTQYDSVFLGGQFLRRAQNFFPATSFRLSKRYGTLADKQVGQNCINITDLLHVTDKGTYYLFAYCHRRHVLGNDFFAVWINDAGPFFPSGCTFGSELKDGHFIRFGSFVYCGNGVDPIKQIKLERTGITQVVDLIPLPPLSVPDDAVGSHPLGGGAIVSTLVPGEYQWCVATYNTSDMFYKSRGAAHKITVNAGEYLSFKAPTTVLAAPLKYRIFVSPVNDPIEFASQQGGDLDAGDTIDVTEVDVNPHFVPLTTNVKRSGSFFTLFLNRLVFGGEDVDQYAAFATGTLLPGTEAEDFNSGLFFPSFARIPMPEEVTAVGVAGITSGFDPQSPLIVQTATRTTLYTGGDPFDPNGSAARVELSARVGNPAPDTGITTPYGYFFLSIDSVYMIPPGGGYPQDVGWPIGNLIRTIPTSRRSDACAIFHKGFLKLAFSGPGSGANDQQWWLDLRQGLTTPPSWWGPMTGFSVSAFTSCVDHPMEYDRGWCAIAQTDRIGLMHQQNQLTDITRKSDGTVTVMHITAVLRTATFDDDDSFLMKVFTRIRALVLGKNHDLINIQVITDTGKRWVLEDMEIFGPEGSHWNHRVPQGLAQWNHLVPQGKAQWSHATILTEAQTIAKLTRPRGLSCEVVATHPSPASLKPDVITYPNIEIRDVQILYLPVDRKVRTLGEKAS
jgi:hypothetical protein